MEDKEPATLNTCDTYLEFGVCNCYPKCRPYPIKEGPSLVDPATPEQTTALLEKLGLPQESRRMSPERHAQFMKELRWAGASEEIVKAMESYPLGTEATYENGYAAGHHKGIGVGITLAMAKISELATLYDVTPLGAAVARELRELAAKLGALV